MCACSNRYNFLISCIRILTNTFCESTGDSSKNSWGTIRKDAKNWINYAKFKWYVKSTSEFKTWNITWLFNYIKTEINNDKPLILHLSKSDSGHAVVVYWYKSWSTPIIRVNLGWWPNSHINWYKTSRIDYNMNSIFYNDSNWIWKAVTTFDIS